MPMYQRLQRLELCRLQLAQLHLASSRPAVSLAPGRVQRAHGLMSGSCPAVPALSLVGDYHPTPNNDLAMSLQVVNALLLARSPLALWDRLIAGSCSRAVDFLAEPEK